MNKDINYTLAALVPLLRMNGEKVVSVEAVEDWYEIDGREYMKEVAEITYENGYRQYADIGCDANLTAVYDVIRVIQQMKPKSEKIERIVRDVYPNPEVPDTNVGIKLGTDLAEVGTKIEPLTDKEQRIFLAAMGRERKVCKEVDDQYTHEPYEVLLTKVCSEIERKVKAALWS